jgi:hypothetical protein
MKGRATVTFSNENGLSRIRPSLDSCPATNVAQRLPQAPPRPFPVRTGSCLVTLGERRP